MSDDLEFLAGRVPGYRAYAGEDERHDSDLRVRAFVGERVTDAQARLGAFEAGAQKEIDDLVLRCMFADQAFIKRFEHAALDARAVATLVRADRVLIELAERLEGSTKPEIEALVRQIGAQLDYRDSPSLLTAS